MSDELYVCNGRETGLLVFRNHVVAKCPPCFSYMRGWTEEEVRRKCTKKKRWKCGTLEEVKQEYYSEVTPKENHG